MRKISRIFVIGRACLNVIMSVRGIPAPGKAVAEQYYACVPGGCGLNAALMFKRLGLDAVLNTRVADDINGNVVMRFCRDNGIDRRFITVEPKQKTGLESMIVTAAGESRCIIYPGANARLSADNTEEAVITTLPDVLFLNLSSPPAAIETASRVAAEKRIPVIVNAMRYETGDFPLEKLKGVEIFITDEESVAAFTGYPDMKPNSYIAICTALSNRTKAKYVVIMQKNDAVLLYNSPYHYLYTPLSGQERTDPFTAVDTFAAALTREYILHGDMERACKFGSIIYAMTLDGAGGSASVPHYDDISAFISKNNIRFDFTPSAGAAKV